MVLSKRKLSDSESSSLVKRTKASSDALSTTVMKSDHAVVKIPDPTARSSGLFSSNMVCEGHGSAIFSLQFSHNGENAVSGSLDRDIFLWKVYDPQCRNYAVLQGHKNAVLQVQFTYDDAYVVSASADKTVGLWDAQTGRRLKKFVGHSSFVNSVSPVRKGPILLVSASDDGTAKLWDIRVRGSVKSFEDKYQLTSAAFTSDPNEFLTGGLDGNIKKYDLRMDDISLVLPAHSNIITGLSVSPNGQFVLSNGMDNVLKKWDIRAFVKDDQDRCQGTFSGSVHGYDRNLIKCNWSPSGNQVIAGSSDRYVNIWDANTTELMYHLPGHNATVNEAVFHPKEPIVGSCGSDKNIYFGELVL